MANFNRLFLPFVLAFVACAPAVYTPQCSVDDDCGVDLICERGMCVEQPAAACRTGETRPCGPPAVGLCRPGTQRCSDRKFTTTCEGQVLPVAEVCDGLDDDCDGVVDDGVAITYYPDADADGFGSSAVGAVKRVACTPPMGFVANNSDCNDSVAAIHPGSTEVCDSANVDEDCSGTANDGCGCANVGMTQACCASRGTQLCEAHPSGPTLSACTVSPTPELCNGVDDDCDGQTDEQFSLVSTDGGSAVTDGGVFALDGGCTVGVGACARSGGTACTSGALGCNATAGSPSTELCNGLDDDCDGQTDENDPGLCPASGQSCTAGSCACPAGQSVCGTSCQAINMTCTAGTGACSRQGTMLCSSGAATCSATAGTPTAEICNNIDDDCDGQIDQTSPTLCSATGQSCSMGACACPSGQKVCGTSCQTLGGSCSVGVGACARTGAVACITGGAACDAVAGAPSTEVCDGVDNNCNGTTDEGVTVNCVVDADNDTAAGGNIVTAQCPDNARIAFGRCPAGYVSTAASSGIDCNDANASVYRTERTYADADSDTRCAGPENTLCIGAAPPAGRRLSASCTSTADCNDNDANAWILGATRADADNDGFCAVVVANTCNGTSAPVGRRFAASCNATADCNDANPALAISRQVRPDVDNDGFCAAGAATTQCGAVAGPNAGTRVAITCPSQDDCRDTNPQAAASCFLTGAFHTGFAQKSCGTAAATEEFSVGGSCPAGFSPDPFSILTSEIQGTPIGTCAPVNLYRVRMTCGFAAVGNYGCRVNGDCIAN